MGEFIVNFGGCRGKTAMVTATAESHNGTGFMSINEAGEAGIFELFYDECPALKEIIDMSIVRTEERLAKRELFREKSSSYNRKCKNTMLARKRKRWNIANNLHRNSFQREGRR